MLKYKYKIFGFMGAVLIFIGVNQSLAIHNPPMPSIIRHGQEALTWCGPAVGQMTMESYPGSGCAYIQSDVWTSILANKVESCWDTDPQGLAGAMKTLCPPPGGTWVVNHQTTQSDLMWWIAYYITRNSYPVAIVMDTQPSALYAPHEEHWVLVRGIVTDLDPTTNSTINLILIEIEDPCGPVGDPPLYRSIAASDWGVLWQPVSKTCSSYNGEYVAVIEPPSIMGRMIIPRPILRGRILPPDEILQYAQKWIKEYKFIESEPYHFLEKAKPVKPVLIKKETGSYYIIHYQNPKTRQVGAAMLVNAYDGSLKELGAFKPVIALSRDGLVQKLNTEFNKRQLKKMEIRQVETTSLHGLDRYFPVWEVETKTKTLKLNRQGEILHQPVIMQTIPVQKLNQKKIKK